MATIAFLSVLFIIIMIHEAGHLICAKFVGVRVKEYAIGLGPRIIGFKKLRNKLVYRLFNYKPSNEEVWNGVGTEYKLCLFPFGGYCALEDELIGDGTSSGLASKPFIQKLLVIMGGIILNVLTGSLAIFSLLFNKTQLFLDSLVGTFIFIKVVSIELIKNLAMLLSFKTGVAQWEDVVNSTESFISWEGLIYMFGFYSIVVAIANILPFPALDGSYPLLWILEKLLGKEKGQKIISRIVYIGFIILMALQFAIVFYWIFF